VLLRKQVVLVVDDDEATREALREVLDDAGYAVATADGGSEAIDFLGKHRADVVVLDLMMPDVDGWAVADHVAGRPDIAHTPVVVMSAQGLKALAAAPAAAAYLAKPVHIDTLLGALRLALTLRPPPLEGANDADAVPRSALEPPRLPSRIDPPEPRKRGRDSRP